MKISTPPFQTSRLIWRLVRFVLISSALFTCLATMTQLYFDFRNQRSDVYNALEAVGEVHISTLTQSLWELDTSMLQLQMDTIANRTGIVKVTLESDFIAVERKSSEGSRSTGIHGPLLKRLYSLTKEHDGKFINLGELKVESSLHHAYQNIIDQTLVIALTNAIKSLIVATIIFMGFQRMVTGRITRLAKFVDECSQNVPEGAPFYVEAVEAEDKCHGRGDEVTVLIDELNALNRSIYDLIDDLTCSKQALTQEKRQISATLMSIDDAVLIMSEHGVIENLNSNVETLFHCQKSELIGQSIHQFSETIGVGDTHPLFFEPTTVEGQLIPMEGKHIVHFHSFSEQDKMSTTEEKARQFLEVHCSPILDADRQYGFVAVARDITESVKLYEEVKYRASHDRLTSLINRHEFEVRFVKALRSKDQYDYTHVLLYLDLDRFKIINDSCGHHAGDEVLVKVANILKSHLRQRDTIARLGGDEFVILLERSSRRSAQLKADQLIEIIGRQCFTFNKTIFKIGVSIGMLVIDQGISSMDEALMKADESCYLAKRLGRNRVQLYSEDQKMAQRRLDSAWATRISRAIEDDSLVIYVQPIVRASVEKNANVDKDYPIAHYEVLIRMQQEGQLYMPDEFLPAADRYSLSPLIDKWVVDKLFAYIGERDLSVVSYGYSINLTAHSLGNDQFIEYLIEKQNSYSVKGHLITIELTESSACEDIARTKHFINRLKARGFRFSLDDFGCGFASYQYLKELPVDFVKIDGSFVKNLEKSPIDRSIVRSILDVSKAMGKKTVAEFVESEAIYNTLVGMGIDYVQGYAVGRPKRLKMVVKEGVLES